MVMTMMMITLYRRISAWLFFHDYAHGDHLNKSNTVGRPTVVVVVVIMSCLLPLKDCYAQL